MEGGENKSHGPLRRGKICKCCGRHDKPRLEECTEVAEKHDGNLVDEVRNWKGKILTRPVYGGGRIIMILTFNR